MGLTSMFLKQWRDGRIKRMREEYETPTAVGSLADLPVAGARWRRNPDGSWMRWSYLGETWEPQTAAPALLMASENNPTVDTWIVGPDGVWKPFEPESKPEEVPPAKDSEQLPPPPPQKLNPDFEPRPEWTSDWKPGWNQEPK